METRTIFFKHPQVPTLVEVKIGFSWTTAFFGFGVPLYRGMYLYAFIFFILTFCTWGLVGIYYPFVMNKHHIKFLLKSGYKPYSVQDSRLVEALDIGYKNNRLSP